MTSYQTFFIIVKIIFMTEIENFSERFATFRRNTNEFIILIMTCKSENKTKPISLLT